MSEAVGLIELRNNIDVIYLQLMSESGGKTVHNDDILARIEKELREELHANRDALRGLSLVKLVNDVSRRRGRSPVLAAGLDLFGEIAGIPPTVSVSRGAKMLTADMSLGDAKAWLKKRPPKPAIDPFEEFRLLVRRLEDEGASDSETLGAILRNKKSVH